MSQNNTDVFEITAEPCHTDMRLDQFIADKNICSRSRAASWIKKGIICINGRIAKPSHKIIAGETVSGYIPRALPRQVEPEPIPLEILFEDSHLIIINKPPGLVVHPAPGHESGTIVNGLLYRYPEIRTIGDSARPGIVHRLDRDTSGALIAARSPESYMKLSSMFASRKIIKKYLALVYGSPKTDIGTISMPIGRHTNDRKKMSVKACKARMAETRWRVIKKFNDASLLEVTIKTGRTHQIRVHCAATETPVVGDGTYGARWTKKPVHFNDKAVFNRLNAVPRQMLHAWKLEFSHPVTDKKIKIVAPVAADMKKLIRDINQLEKK